MPLFALVRRSVRGTAALLPQLLRVGGDVLTETSVYRSIRQSAMTRLPHSAKNAARRSCVSSSTALFAQHRPDAHRKLFT